MVPQGVIGQVKLVFVSFTCVYICCSSHNSTFENMLRNEFMPKVIAFFMISLLFIDFRLLVLSMRWTFDIFRFLDEMQTIFLLILHILYSVLQVEFEDVG
jgi:hypothetical protein